MNSGCQGVDASLDGVAMIVNGVLLTDPDMVEELLQQNGFLEVATIFVQAERTSGFWRFLDRHGITLKKSLQAAERQRADVARARRRWIRGQGMLDPARLVFIDETAVSTNLARVRGRAPRGDRVIGTVPLGTWKTITFVAALRHDKMTAPMVVEGANPSVDCEGIYLDEDTFPAHFNGRKPVDAFVDRETLNGRVASVRLWHECVSARGLDHNRQGGPIIRTQRNQWAEGVPMMPMGVIFRSAFTPA